MQTKEERDKLIIEGFIGGKTLRELGPIVGLSVEGVRHVLHRHSIDTSLYGGRVKRILKREAFTKRVVEERILGESVQQMADRMGVCYCTVAVAKRRHGSKIDKYEKDGMRYCQVCKKILPVDRFIEVTCNGKKIKHHRQCFRLSNSKWREDVKNRGYAGTEEWMTYSNFCAKFAVSVGSLSHLCNKFEVERRMNDKGRYEYNAWEYQRFLDENRRRSGT